MPLDPDKPYYASGANIVRFPAGGHLHGWQLADKATEGLHLTHSGRECQVLHLCRTCSLPAIACSHAFAYSTDMSDLHATYYEQLD